MLSSMIWWKQGDGKRARKHQISLTPWNNYKANQLSKPQRSSYPVNCKRGKKKSDTVKIGIKWSNKKWRTSKYLVLASRPKHHSSEMSALHHHGLYIYIYIYALQSSTEEIKTSTIQDRQELTSFKWRMYAYCCRNYISTHSISYKVLWLA